VTSTEPTEGPGWALFAQWHSRIERGDPAFSMLSTVQEVAGPLARLETSVRASVWNMQRHHSTTRLRDAAARDAVLRRKGWKCAWS
jgi:hypothetical protein